MDCRSWLALSLIAVACTKAPGSDIAISGGTGGEGGETGGSTEADASTAAESSSSSSVSSSDSEGGSTGDPGCDGNEDCVDDPAGPLCDVLTGTCYDGCEPGATAPCYSGPPGTEDVGACVAGMHVCKKDGTWDGWCEGEVVPAEETCQDGVDDDCDGTVDDTDQDGDGYGACSGDCCDIEGAPCIGAVLVNPGAFEVADNDVDDDCDGMLDEVTPGCDEGLASNSNAGMDYARAIDLCQQTEEDPANPADKTWGVIEAELSLADGTGQPLVVQRSIRPGFGDFIETQAGAALAMLSSGHAADKDDMNPTYAGFEPGVNLNTAVTAPPDWLVANGGSFPNPAGCPAPWSTDANDSAMLRLRIRVPTNAQSFTMKMYFFSAEYPEFVCSDFNDFFVTLVGSSAVDNPADGNIAVYDDGGTLWPVGVNLVMVADGLFAQCENGQVGCEGAMATDYQGCLGTADLPGTGFDDPDTACAAPQTFDGGGTGWLAMSGNVTPGEIMEIRFAVWDASGHILDSLVLLDAWQWSLDAAAPGIAPG